ncbi:ABC transporter permease [Polyangium sp. y55x31]|uniref:ABC transporter permease n=1 Tax=Polyangium sp. y55x31 TaxID=3042688 RepID=UPI002482AE15|nr:ABC transporter permease [Polyangium sp. y55x31]MDI1483601.1 ABC transporter permease [Polyangium sp. y55x31]
MIRLLLKKLLESVLLLLVVATLVFVLVRLLPGGPFDRERAVPPAVDAALRAKYRLDAPILGQYRDWMVDLVVHGNLGPTFKYPNRTVNEIIAVSLPVSLQIGSLALALALAVGLPLGVLGAVWRGRPANAVLMAAVTLGVSIPRLVLGPLLVLVFALGLGLFPVARWETWRHAILPALCAALPVGAHIARLARTGMLDVLGADFIRTARAKGLSERQAVLRHALPVALAPVVSFLGPAASGLLVGSVVVERIFDLPGMGRYFVDAAANRDYNLVTGVVLVYASILVVLDALADVARTLLDRRTELR